MVLLCPQHTQEKEESAQNFDHHYGEKFLPPRLRLFLKRGPVMNAPRERLDTAVINIELTLGSIIQGVALYFLVENARSSLSLRNWGAAIYVVAGLCVIFIFWSRSVIHTLTLIRWPLEFGHNFFYIACALVEAVLFTRIDRPEAWFRLSAIYAGLVWFLFIYDIRLINARKRDAITEEERAVIRLARADQFRNIFFLIPLLVVFNAGCFALLRSRPEYFVQQGNHVWLALAQLGLFAIYLVYVTRFFARIAPLVARSRGATD